VTRLAFSGQSAIFDRQPLGSIWVIDLYKTAMKILLLMRHAKASPGTAGVADFDRPLVDEGKNAAARIGLFLKREMLPIDLALSSPAARARETIEEVLQAAGWSLEVRADDRLYESGALQLFEVLSEVDENLNAVLLVGHNPVLEEFVLLLTGENVHLSPGTLAHIDLEAAKFSEVGENTGTLSKVVRPKELIDS
jgi:phosphohistidine phosphatase